MGSGCCCVSKPVFQLGKPMVSGGTVTPCFDDGRLFKIEKGDYWYFYNDTQAYKMTVTVDFGAGSQVERATGKDGAERAKLNNNSDGSCNAQLLILPLETLPLMKGAKKVNGFKSKYNADPFSSAEKAQAKQKAENLAATETQKMTDMMRKNSKIDNSHRLLKAARKKGHNFVDSYFPPSQKSLARPGMETMSNIGDYFWQRPDHYLPEQWRDKITLFESKCSPKDIDQGALGDCYFLCACASLAEHRDDLYAVFTNQHSCCTERSEEKYGGFRVLLNINGWWKQYVIDSYLPSKSLLPAFARNRQHPNELWPSFLEKAYAKAYGSYQSIESGFPWQAQEDLTGYPSFSFADMWQEATENEDIRAKLFKLLERWNSREYLLSVATPNNAKTTATARRKQAKKDFEALFDKAGLATGHAYTVLDVKHFPLHRLCLMKIRNPWGNNVEWTGDWSDESNKWKEYPTIKLACRPAKKDDGIFWMEWSDVINFFDSGSVCFRQGSWRDTWYNYRVVSQFKDNVPNLCLEVVCHTDCEAFFTVHQKDKRGLAPSDPDSKYAAIMMSVFEGELESEEQNLVTCSGGNPDEVNTKYTFQIARCASCAFELKKDKRYFIVPRRMTSSNSNNTPNKTYVISMHCNRDFFGGCSNKNEINFVQLNANNEVFRNIQKFKTGQPTRVTSTYQFRKGTKMPSSHEGTSFNEGKKVNHVAVQNMI